jgi:hypothetical protein
MTLLRGRRASAAVVLAATGALLIGPAATAHAAVKCVGAGPVTVTGKPLVPAVEECVPFPDVD